MTTISSRASGDANKKKDQRAKMGSNKLCCKKKDFQKKKDRREKLGSNKFCCKKRDFFRRKTGEQRWDLISCVVKKEKDFQKQKDRREQSWDLTLTI